MKTRLLRAYAELMCRAIWAIRSRFPAIEGALPDITVTKRDFEWTSWHYCEVCLRGGKHRFIAWADEDVTTAECPHCGLEATL
jgi:hypothetical protein